MVQKLGVVVGAVVVVMLLMIVVVILCQYGMGEESQGSDDAARTKQTRQGCERNNGRTLA